ncbi:HlyD family efflux transporter periplasmic adaptor subunit [Chitinophaga lutea]|uniref:HlyD family efflux transporter periplasmic adaptor subunit n=1 Tax=Chitinophaga lutea TaxID=2488634 RepID=A0A3N4PKS7_9BACT|nr:HlyD family efflux transporter periplasmic adaptor subunit [Chitinophaga lutea]RPE08148.1 HlyD family efflux transporter periplasmic adaptor subunit [Chitinophaga lutea]
MDPHNKTLLSAQDLESATQKGNFEDRSEITQEIISREPGFIEKWALMAFLGILVILLSGIWFVQYPDIVQGSAVLTGDNAPKEIVAKQSGKLIALFAKNNQAVQQGEIIGWLESTAAPAEVISLSGTIAQTIEALEQNRPGSIPALFKQRFHNLGEVQAAYQTFITALQQYNDYLVNGFYDRKKNMLHDDIASLQDATKKIAEQKGLTLQENEIAKKTFEMNERLYKDKVISTEEYRQAQSKLLNSQMVLPQADVNIIGKQSQIRDKQKEIDQLDHDMLQQQQIFWQALQTLKSGVDEWMRTYTLRAPIDGQVVFVLPLQPNRYVEQGKLLAYVNPQGSQYYVEVKMSQKNFGKVDTGMKVQLRFDAYPYEEAGFVSGRLNYISDVAVDSFFIGTVRLDQGLLTSQQRNLPFKNGLKGQALIITKDMRLMQRLYHNIVRSTSLGKK